MKKTKILIIGLYLLVVSLLAGCSDTIAKVELGDYLAIKVEVSETFVTDEDVEAALLVALTENQEIVEIKERAVILGDTVNIDYLGRVDNVAFEGGTATGYDLVIGSNSFIEGFEEQIIGMTIGQTADIEVRFPDNYRNIELAGAEAVFTVKVNSIKGKKLPAKITDSMVQAISDDFTTVEEYREYLREQLENEAEIKDEQNKQFTVWSLIVKNSTVTGMATKKIDYYGGLFEYYYQQYADMYSAELEDFIVNYIGVTRTEFDEYKKEYAENQIINVAIAQAIAKEQNIVVSDEDYKTYVTENNMAAEDETRYGESVKDDLLIQKVVEFVTANAEITIITK